MLSGDHVYKMDYGRMLRFHKERGAAATIATIEVPREDAARFGVVRVDADDRVVGFLEKPSLEVLGPGDEPVLASMGIYIFRMDMLVPALEADAASASHHDFGKDILPALIAQAPVLAHRFYDENKKAAKYWRDIGTLDAYYEANMDLCQVNPEFNLYDPDWPIRTSQPQAPPAKFVFADDWRRGEAIDSTISSGCIISGSRITGSVLCPNVRVHSFCSIEQSILLPGVRVGRHARIRRAHHRPRRVRAARRPHRLPPRRGSPAPHGHRSRHRRRHPRRRGVHGTGRGGGAAARGGGGPAGHGLGGGHGDTGTTVHGGAVRRR